MSWKDHTCQSDGINQITQSKVTNVTSILVDPAINIVQTRLQYDLLLPEITSMSIPQIITLLEFCLKNTYYLLQGKYFEQVPGVAMDSPISPLIANLFMEESEVKAISSAPNLPMYGSGLWMTPLSFKKQNNVTSSSSTSTPMTHIQFTEDPKEDSSISSLDTLMSMGPNNTLTTTVYHKPTHMD